MCSRQTQALNMGPFHDSQLPWVRFRLSDLQHEHYARATAPRRRMDCITMRLRSNHRLWHSLLACTCGYRVLTCLARPSKWLLLIIIIPNLLLLLLLLLLWCWFKVHLLLLFWPQCCCSHVLLSGCCTGLTAWQQLRPDIRRGASRGLWRGDEVWSRGSVASCACANSQLWSLQPRSSQIRGQGNMQHRLQAVQKRHDQKCVKPGGAGTKPGGVAAQHLPTTTWLLLGQAMTAGMRRRPVLHDRLIKRLLQCRPV